MPRNRKTITLSLPPEMDEQIRRFIEEEDRTMSEFLREAIRLYSSLRPSAAVGDPAGAGVFLRPQRMRDLWRSPEDRRRPDRSGLDADLSGGGRAAGDAPAEGPAASAVRVRRLTCLLDPAPGVRRGVPSTLPQASN